MGPTCVKSPNATLRLDFMEAQRCLSSKKRKQHCQIYFRKKKNHHTVYKQKRCVWCAAKKMQEERTIPPW